MTNLCSAGVAQGSWVRHSCEKWGENAFKNRMRGELRGQQEILDAPALSDSLTALKLIAEGKGWLRGCRDARPVRWQV